MVTFYFRAIDDPEGWTKEFDTIEAAVKYFHHMMGWPYDIGSSYAVNSYGDVTCTVDGATWKELGLE